MCGRTETATCEGRRCPDPTVLFLVWTADLRQVHRLAERAGTQMAAVDYLETTIVGFVDTALAAQNAAVAESLGPPPSSSCSPARPDIGLRAFRVTQPRPVPQAQRVAEICYVPRSVT